MSEEVKLDWKLINEKMKYYGMEIEKRDVVKKIEEIDPKEIEDDLRRFLPKKQRALIGNLKELVMEKI